MNYTPNPVYYYPQPQPQPPKGSNGAATASLVLGIVALFCCGMPLSIVAIICAIVSKSKSPDGRMNGMAVAGLVLGIIGVVMGVIGLIWGAISLLPLIPLIPLISELISSGEFAEAMEEILAGL